MASALQHLHSRGIAHMDVKPDNIYSTEDGQFKLGDFGLATALWGSKTLDVQEGDARSVWWLISKKATFWLYCSSQQCLSRTPASEAASLCLARFEARAHITRLKDSMLLTHIDDRRNIRLAVKGIVEFPHRRDAKWLSVFVCEVYLPISVSFWRSLCAWKMNDLSAILFLKGNEWSKFSVKGTPIQFPSAVSPDLELYGAFLPKSRMPHPYAQLVKC